jgi:hypothetical protein
MMDIRYAVCGRRAFIKNKFTLAVPVPDTSFKSVILIPHLQDILVYK